MEYRILPRSEVREMVRNFVIDNNIYAQYGTDSEGLFQVNFVVEEETEDEWGTINKQTTTWRSNFKRKSRLPATRNKGNKTKRIWRVY